MSQTCLFRSGGHSLARWELQFHCCLSLMSMTALGLPMATSPSQNANVECFSPIDRSLEVKSCRSLSWINCADPCLWELEGVVRCFNVHLSYCIHPSSQWWCTHRLCSFLAIFLVECTSPQPYLWVCSLTIHARYFHHLCEMFVSHTCPAQTLQSSNQ